MPTDLLVVIFLVAVVAAAFVGALSREARRKNN